MAVYFFDASAVVKRYVRETGSIWVRQICEAHDESGNKRNLVAIAEISRVEVAAAFALLVRRKEMPKILGDRAYKQFVDEVDRDYQSMRLTPPIISNAAELTQRHPLKAYDAVQLATALAFAKSSVEQSLFLIFVSADKTLLQAAEAEGLQVDNPLNHA